LNGGIADARYYGASQRVKKALVKAYALSMLHLYSGSPVIPQFALWLLQFTKNSKWSVVRRCLLDRLRYKLTVELTEQEMPLSALVPQVRMATASGRILMERLHGLPCQTQLDLEWYFAHNTDGVFPDHILLPFYPACAVQFYDNYRHYGFRPVVYVNQKSKNVVPALAGLPPYV